MRQSEDDWDKSVKWSYLKGGILVIKIFLVPLYCNIDQVCW